MRKIIIASDKYKGCLTSMEVATAIEKGILSVFPVCEIIKLPVADGGDGTMAALVEGTKGSYREIMAMDPLMRPIQTRYGILGDEKTAIVEVAAASGLALLDIEELNPMLSTSYGTGQLILDVLEQGCTDFIVGIGGSATNDAATGILQALGYRFLDASGKELGHGGQILSHIASIDVSSATPLLKNAYFKIACDVDNVFSGEKGAAYIYAPQKGADPSMVKALDDGLKQYASVIRKTFHQNIEHIPGSGAAGGIGGGMLAFLNATLHSGVDIVLDGLQFDNHLKGADWVITGEGRIDAQTSMGKVLKGVSKAAAQKNIPVIALAGSIENLEAINAVGITGIFSITPGPMPLGQAMDPETAGENLFQTVRQLFSVMKIYS